MKLKNIKGNILDKKSGLSIEYAAIFQNNTDLDGAETNQDGFFDLQLDPDGAKSIEVSADGYKTANFPIIKPDVSPNTFTFKLVPLHKDTKAIKKISEKIQETKQDIQAISKNKKVLKAEIIKPDKGDKFFKVIIVLIVIGVILAMYVIYKYNKKGITSTSILASGTDLQVQQKSNIKDIAISPVNITSPIQVEMR